MEIRRKFTLLTIFTLFLYLTTTTAKRTQNSCSVNGIDLSPLTIPAGGKYYTATDPKSGNVFMWNICGPVPGSFCTTSDTAVCQNSYGKYWSCGLYSTQTLTQNSETMITVSYINGDTCTGQVGHPKRATFIQLICSNDVVPIVSVVDENACSYTLQMKTMYACATPPTPSPSPSPSAYNAGYDPCNAIKVKTIPSVFSNNLANGSEYKSGCHQGPSIASQFYYYIPAESGHLNVSTCGLTSMDTIINVYVGPDCEWLKGCVASNDDGCCDSAQTQSTLSLDVVKGTHYYIEVRTYGSSPAGPYSITFYN